MTLETMIILTLQGGVFGYALQSDSKKTSKFTWLALVVVNAILVVTYGHIVS